MRKRDRIRLFKKQAEAVQAVVPKTDGRLAAFEQAAELTAQRGGATLAAVGFGAADREAIAQACGRHGLTLWTQGLRDHAREIFTGLTPALAGIAETGTLVLESSDEDLRLASMLCELHVAVLDPEDIVDHAEDLAATLKARFAQAPNYLAFITGPSRTADIERVLTIGVHGPADLVIMLPEAQS